MIKILMIVALAITAYSNNQAKTNTIKEEKLGLLGLYINETKTNCRKESKYYKRAVKASRDYKGR